MTQMIRMVSEDAREVQKSKIFRKKNPFSRQRHWTQMVLWANSFKSSRRQWPGTSRVTDHIKTWQAAQEILRLQHPDPNPEQRKHKTEPWCGKWDMQEALYLGRWVVSPCL